MSKPLFAILRFAKYKGPEISNIEAHNERTKEEYASNPDIDKSRSCLNFHLLEPEHKYRAEAERQSKDAGCRTRSDSVRVVEALVTATPEFFKGKADFIVPPNSTCGILLDNGVLTNSYPRMILYGGKGADI